MKLVEGWHCPELLAGPGKYMRRAIEDAPRAIDLCKHKRVAIQAGGHVGTWPVFLSKHFETVYTFEPVYENFACLIRNIADHAERPESIFAACGAVGNKRGPIEMIISGKSTGQHRARVPESKSVGTVPVYRIDDLELPIVDAIFLDLEGFENHALRGASETLKRCRPVVMAENNKRAENQGFKLGDLEVLMRCENYRLFASVTEDLIFTPRVKG